MQSNPVAAAAFMAGAMAGNPNAAAKDLGQAREWRDINPHRKFRSAPPSEQQAAIERKTIAQKQKDRANAARASRSRRLARA